MMNSKLSFEHGLRDACITEPVQANAKLLVKRRSTTGALLKGANRNTQHPEVRRMIHAVGYALLAALDFTCVSFFELQWLSTSIR